MAAGFAVCNPARPAHSASVAAPPPQSTAFPWLAAARLAPLLVPLVDVVMVVVVLMADETCSTSARVLPLLVVLLLFYCLTYTPMLVLSLYRTLVSVLLGILILADIPA